MRKLAFFAILMTLLAASCKKETVTLTAAQVLQSKVWKLSSKTENGTAVTLATCAADDKVTYSVSGSYEYNFGTTKCAGEPNATTGNWSVDGSTLKIVTNSTTTSYTIKSYDSAKSTQFILSYTNTATGGVTKTVEETYVAAQ
jgi:Lipocalin-like domain